MSNLFKRQAVLQQGQAGTTLSETITGTAHLVKNYSWSILKEAFPSSLDLFRGDTGTVSYTITVKTTGFTTEAYIEGIVTICNGGDLPTDSLKSTIILSKPPSKDPINTMTLDVSQNPVIAAHKCASYSYKIDIPDFQPDAEYKVTADTTIMNHSGSIGIPTGPNESVSVMTPNDFTDFINGTIHVTDTNKVNGLPFSATFTATDTPVDQTASYTLDYHCAQDELPFANPTTTKYTNTAKISETGQTSEASVYVNCYDLIVTKTANTSFTRTWNWTISKKAYIPDTTTQITGLVLQPDQSFDLQYRIAVSPSFADSNPKVSGIITVKNPSSTLYASIIGARDVITLPEGTSPITVNPSPLPSPSNPIIISPGESITFDYSSALPDYASRIDQAFVTLQNTPSGTTEFKSEKMTFGFSLDNPTEEIDPCVNVYDSYPEPNTKLNSSPLCRIGSTFQYTRTVGPYPQCSNIQFSADNTAMYVSISSGKSGSATSIIPITVPCSSGCTLTIGYWKTHAGFGPAPSKPDAVSSLLPISLGQASITGNDQAYAILSFYGWYAKTSSPGTTPDASNGINKLYAQLLAALLNSKRGASIPPSIGQIIEDANSFLLTHDSSSWGSLSSAQRKRVLNDMTELDAYNSGLRGVQHCSE